MTRGVKTDVSNFRKTSSFRNFCVRFWTSRNLVWKARGQWQAIRYVFLLIFPNLLSFADLLSLDIYWLPFVCSFGEGNGTPLQYSCLENPMDGGPGRLQSMGLLRVRHNWETSLSLFTFTHWRRKWQPTPVFLPGDSQGRGSLVGCRFWGHTELDTTEVT